MSKAVFSLQRSIRFQRAVFFALINPQVAALTHCQILPSFLVGNNLLLGQFPPILAAVLYRTRMDAFLPATDKTRLPFDCGRSCVMYVFCLDLWRASSSGSAAT